MISGYFYLFGVAQDRFSAGSTLSVSLLKSLVSLAFFVQYEWEQSSIRSNVGVFNILGFAFCHSVKLGFFTYAPHVLVVAGLPMLLGTRKGAASVTGFIDMMGYVGATITGIATALFTGLGGWNMAFTFWAVGAFGSAMALALLWNLKKKKETYM